METDTTHKCSTRRRDRPECSTSVLRQRKWSERSTWDWEFQFGTRGSGGQRISRLPRALSRGAPSREAACRTRHGITRRSIEDGRRTRTKRGQQVECDVCVGSRTRHAARGACASGRVPRFDAGSSVPVLNPFPALVVSDTTRIWSESAVTLYGFADRPHGTVARV